MSEANNDIPKKYYVTCGDWQLVIAETEPMLAAMEITSRAMTQPSGPLLGPMVFVSQQGFRSADDMDSRTAIFSLFSVLVLLGYQFRPGGKTDQIFRRPEYGNDENEG